MPAASAEKRARQRAKKLMQAKSESTAKPDMPLSTDPLPTNYATVATSFAMFISHANLSDIKLFFEAAGSSQESTNLKIFWGRAFAEGKKVGQKEEYDRGYSVGYNEGYSEACEKDYEAGLAENTSVSTAEIGTQVDLLPVPCIDISVQTTIDAPIAVLSDQIVQTDLEPPILSHTTDSMVQTISSSSSSISTQTEPISEPPIPTTVAPTPFNCQWADDPVPFPTQLLPTTLSPRNFAGFRSSNPNPSSSLQHRSRHFTHYSRQPRRCHSHSNFNSFYSSHGKSYKPSQPHFHTKTYSHLNWESDPRLSDLSRSLKALGWIRAS